MAPSPVSSFRRHALPRELSTKTTKVSGRTPSYFIAAAPASLFQPALPVRSRRELTREIHALGDEASVASYGLTYPDLFSGGS